jgi:ATP-binding protein involved in chromosome partitioning
MAAEQEKKVWALLQGVQFPGMSRDIVSFGFVDRVAADADRIEVDLAISSHNQQVAQQVKGEVERIVKEANLAPEIEVNLKFETPASTAQQAVSQSPDLIPGVEHVVAVASGKGGVGKSTVAANLAVTLGRQGSKVGLLDADIYGPSVPMMFGVSGRPVVHGDRIQPFEKYGIKLMSLGFLLDVDTPVIWRGPMVMRAVEQMLGDVDWGQLDFLIVDLPPGTGDAQLTLSQRVPLSGAVIVSTPQDIALIDARKGLAMFEKVAVPVVGIIENMSTFVCPHCGEETDIFKRGGAERTSEILGCAFLGRIPLDPAIVAGGDAGEPIVVSQADSTHAQAFAAVANAVVAEVEKRQAPKISIF